MTAPVLPYATARLPVHTAVGEAIFPLNEFYARAGKPLPAFEAIPGADLPEPYRKLLFHDRDMTPTLEDYHRSDIHIEVLGRERIHRRDTTDDLVDRDADEHRDERGG